MASKRLLKEKKRKNIIRGLLAGGARINLRAASGQTVESAMALKVPGARQEALRRAAQGTFTERGSGRKKKRK